MLEGLTGEEQITIALGMYDIATINYGRCVTALDDMVATTHYNEAYRQHDLVRKLISMPGMPNLESHLNTLSRFRRNADERMREADTRAIYQADKG